jgi:hypothetical protein
MSPGVYWKCRCVRTLSASLTDQVPKLAAKKSLVAAGNETKNCLPTRHHEGADILCAQPVSRSLDADFRGYCRDAGAFLP